MTTGSKIEHDETIHEKVREGYGAIAETGGSCCSGSSCGSGTSLSDHAKRLGYSEDDVAAIPDGANLGLSCGNPVAIASLNPGEFVLDLGSGGGMDVFLAGRRVGAEGRVIGVDMTPAMVSRARRNTSSYVEATGWENVEFRLGEIEHLPVADSSVDVVISNCVINLSPDKAQVWREIARVLRPGGRVSVSDIALLHPLPEELRDSVEALVGCVAGALLVDDIEPLLREAGLTDIELTTQGEKINAVVDGADGLAQQMKQALPAGTNPSDFAVSLGITAKKTA